MKKLIKMDFLRLQKSALLLVCDILAMIITWWFVKNKPIPQLADEDINTLAILASAGITFFFSIFTGILFGSEREEGILRNKIMAGHSQKEIFFSQYIVLLVAMGEMTCFWFIGALAGGARIDGQFFLYVVVSLVFNSAFIALVQAICFRAKKQVTGVVVSLAVFYFFSFGILIENFLYMITEGNPVPQFIIAVIYNISAVGQCFARTTLADPGLANTVLQLVVSLAVMGVALFAGTVNIAKRDVN